MGFRALLFSKSVESNAAMTTACASADIRLKPQPDIFNAIEQVKKSKYSCIIVDWADQPEANFLLKRARESNPNRETVSIVIVDHEPTQAEMHDNHLDLLIYRPISQTEAVEVLAKGREKMQPADVDDDVDDFATVTTNPRGETQISSLQETSDSNASSQQDSPTEDGSSFRQETDSFDSGSVAALQVNRASSRRRWPVLLAGCAAFAIAAALYLVGPHDAIERATGVAKHALTTIQNAAASAFYKPKVAAVPVTPTTIEYQPDSKVSDSGTNASLARLGVVATESMLADAPTPLPRAFDFPLPEPTVERAVAVPVRVARAPIPDSMRNSPPIAPPVVVTVNPAQMMPVSHSLVPPAAQQVSEPVLVSEETERALLVRQVNAAYPPEGAAQKLHGPVVLQTLIGRDGTVEDIKIIRGYFVLGKAASTAVKQWRFQPYTVNGRAVSIQTTITINFSYPPS